MKRTYREEYQHWLDSPALNEKEWQELDSIKNDDKEIESRFYAPLEFGTAGLRGTMKVGLHNMNVHVIRQTTQAFANVIARDGEQAKQKGIVICFDCRINSDVFAREAACVMAANGIHVRLFQSLHPTPELSFAVRYYRTTAGLNITASHNPKEYNGYKVFWSDGAQITSPVDVDIVAEVAKITDPSMVLFRPVEGVKPGKIDIMGADVDERYLHDILSLTLSPEACSRHKDIKFVYTPLHGCGVRLVPECLRRLGFVNVFHVPEQDISDGNFPTVAYPNPEDPGAMKMAIEVADKNQADIVIATDPDADRMGIAVRDDKGEMVRFNGNQTGSMLTYYILSRWKELGKLDASKYVVKTIVTTPLIAEIAESFGVKCYDVLTGFKYIAGVVRENEDKGEFICGGEESFGFNVGQFVRDKDAQIAASMVAECAAWAADQGLSLYGLMLKIYKEYGYRKEGLTSVVRKGKSGAEEIQKIMAELRQNPPKELAGSPVIREVDYMESEKTGLPKSNVLQFFDKDGDVVTVRPSGTEPKIKFYYGAKGADADEKIKLLDKQFVK